jgi:hypothetical protein
MAYIRKSRTVVIEVCLPFNFAVIFQYIIYFWLPPSKAQFIGHVLMNRQNAAFGSMVFFLLKRALPIDASNHLALVGDVL